jgi:Class III cytochrome C family
MKNCKGNNNCLDHQTIFFLCAILLVAVWAVMSVDATEDARGASATSESDSGKTVDLEAGPILDAMTSPTTRYVPVVFATHDSHAQRLQGQCKTCHHDLDETGKIPAACSSCHNVAKAPVKLADAMHKSCRGCHMANKKEDGKSTAPVECMGCHKERQ